MKKFILKLLGIDIDYYKQIKIYNEAVAREKDILDFQMIEDKIKSTLFIYNDMDKKSVVLFLKALRDYTDTGFPVEKYRKLSNKYDLYDPKLYKRFIKASL